MTSETKHFIELSDVLGFRFECKNCHTSVMLPLNEFQAGLLYNCPNCRRDWASVKTPSGGGSGVINYEPTLTKFIHAFNELKSNFYDKSIVGCTLRVEVSGPNMKADT